ncbi:MAG TPA: pitrilysin family protein [Gammaproteobacteria bacterium]|jgi:zinc protease|nr:pitrilysin family protein [Gammaproteobacteria bacterium]HJP37862.1 pitrilysin family protein [Gammaproteobacteria bacterium]
MRSGTPWLTRLLLTCLCAGIAPAGLTSDINIPYQKFTLDNGLRLIVHEDDQAPVVAVNIWYHVGSKNEAPGRTGFAHLFEHLMFQGSENYDDEYLLFLQQLGATNLNATTWFDRTNYFETIPKNALDTVLWLESDRMGHFADSITQAKLDEQRGVVQNEKRQSENQPYGTVWSYLLKQLFPDGHPYAWETIGSMDDLDAATIDDVKAWFNTYYGPNNAVLSIAGDVSADDVLQKVELYFGDIPPGPPLTRATEWIPEHRIERRRIMQDRVPQSRLYKVWTGPRWGTTEAVQLALAARILANGKNSRLYERLAYTEQTVTDVILAPLALEIAGITRLVATAQPGIELTAVEATINEEIDRFIDDGPTHKELKRAKTQMRAGFLRGIERVGGSSGKAGILAKNLVYGNSADAYKDYLAAIDAASAKDLRLIADKWLGRNAFIIEVHPYPELAPAPEGADRSKIPEPGPAPEVSFPPFTRTELDNGMEVIVIERNDIPLVEMSMLLDSGYAADQFSRPGTTAMAMAMLDEGTHNRSALDISETLSSLGANLRASATLDNAIIRMSALSENLAASLDIFADVTLHPAFPQAELVRLRRNTLASIEQEKMQPVSMALRVMPRLLYGADHAYGQPLTGSGTTDSVTAITRDDLKAFHDTWFKPNKAQLIVVGNVDHGALMARIEKLFGNWRPDDVPEKNLEVKTVNQQQTIFLIDRPGADQSVIFAGQLLPPRANPDEIALQAMNDILGGLSSARINMNLREDKGWSYGAFSLIVGARGERPLLVYAPVQTDKTREAIAEITAELDAIITSRPPTEPELGIVKRSKTLSLPGRWETNADIIDALNKIISFNLPDDYWLTYAAEVNQLNLADVSAAAEKYIHPNDLSWVVVGDRTKIESTLVELGFKSIQLIDTDGKLIVSD